MEIVMGAVAAMKDEATRLMEALKKVEYTKTMTKKKVVGVVEEVKKGTMVGVSAT